jgi:hypothetical protein
MQLLAVRTARFIAAITTEELNPRGLVIYPSLIEGLIAKYDFDTYPDDDAELDETKGIVFENGNWNGILIDIVTIFGDGIVIDTRSSTKDSEAIFNEAMEWASKSVGITYSPDMVSRKIYVSELVLRSEVGFNSLNPALESFSEKLSNTIGLYAGQVSNYTLNGVTFSYDSSHLNTSVAPFRIDRLEKAAYSENKYYAVAPLPTEEHLKLLEEFEAILSNT